MSIFARANNLSILIMGGAAVLLTACVSGRPDVETYTSRSGTVMAIESDRELCIRSCNEQYERCNDRQTPMRSTVGSEPGPRLFDVTSDCRNALQSCLPRCRGR